MFAFSGSWRQLPPELPLLGHSGVTPTSASITVTPQTLPPSLTQEDPVMTLGLLDHPGASPYLKTLNDTRD